MNLLYTYIKIITSRIISSITYFHICSYIKFLRISFIYKFVSEVNRPMGSFLCEAERFKYIPIATTRKELAEKEKQIESRDETIAQNEADIQAAKEEFLEEHRQ